MKSNMLLLLTRPVRSPLHSSLVYPQRTLASALFRSLGRHQSEIVFGVLVVIFRGDCIAALRFSSGERQIPLIVSLRVGRARGAQLGEWTTEGALVTIRRSKTDQEGLGRRVGIPKGDIACTGDGA
jgi:hypothetical protein